MPRLDNRDRPKRKNGWERPFDLLQVISWGLLVMFPVLFYIFSLPFLKQPLNFILGAIYSISLISTYILNLITASSNAADPGIYQGHNLAVDTPEGRMECDTCQAFVHRSSKHCRKCNKCVVGFDHHCKWLNNCVGARNYKLFFGFLCSTLVTALLHLSISVYQFIDVFLDKEHYEAVLSSRYPTAIPVPAFLSVMGVSFLLATVTFLLLTHLFGFHVMLVFHKQTTYEWLMARRDKRRKDQLRRADLELQKMQERDSSVDVQQYNPQEKMFPQPQPETETGGQINVLPLPGVGHMIQQSTNANSKIVDSFNPIGGETPGEAEDPDPEILGTSYHMSSPDIGSRTPNGLYPEHSTTKEIVNYRYDAAETPTKDNDEPPVGLGFTKNQQPRSSDNPTPPHFPGISSLQDNNGANGGFTGGTNHCNNNKSLTLANIGSEPKQQQQTERPPNQQVNSSTDALTTVAKDSATRNGVTPRNTTNPAESAQREDDVCLYDDNSNNQAANGTNFAGSEGGAPSTTMNEDDLMIQMDASPLNPPVVMVDSQCMPSDTLLTGCTATDSVLVGDNEAAVVNGHVHFPALNAPISPNKTSV